MNDFDNAIRAAVMKYGLHISQDVFARVEQFSNGYRATACGGTFADGSTEKCIQQWSDLTALQRAEWAARAVPQEGEGR